VESVISAELSIAVVEESVTIFVVAAVETISELPKIAEAISPGEINGWSFYYLVFGRYLSMLLHCPHPNKVLTTDVTRSKVH